MSDRVRYRGTFRRSATACRRGNIAAESCQVVTGHALTRRLTYSAPIHRASNEVGPEMKVY